jgi:hypothetical protein
VRKAEKKTQYQAYGFVDFLYHLQDFFWSAAKLPARHYAKITPALCNYRQRTPAQPFIPCLQLSA